MKWHVAGLALLALAFSARGAITDYVCEDITDQMAPGWPSSARVQYWHKDTASLGKAWVVRFDLTDKHWRFVTRLGRDNDTTANNRLANMQTMANAIVAEDSSRNPLVGINGNYFTNPQDKDEQGNYKPINCYGSILSDFVTVQGGAYPLVQAADLKIKLNEEFPQGTKLRNGSSFYATPPIRYANGEFNVDTQTEYPRSLVGVGDNVFVFLISDGRRDDWSKGVLDRDAVEMVVSNGCHTVAENDGGGSAQMWIKDLPDGLAPRDRNFINKTSDSSPRAVAEGLFMLYEDEFVARARIASGPYSVVNPFDIFDHALLALASSEKIEVLEPIVLKKSWTNAVSCTIVSTNAEPELTPVKLADGATLCFGGGKDKDGNLFEVNHTLTNVAFTAADGVTPVPISVGKKGILRVAGKVLAERIVTPEPESLVIYNQLLAPVVVDCAKGTEEGEPFATIDRNQVKLGRTAFVDTSIPYLVHPTDPDAIAVAAGLAHGDGTLTWAKGHVRVGDRKFATLHDANAHLAPYQAMEVLDPIAVSEPLTITCPVCTLTATNADVLASVVTMTNGNLNGSITVGAGAYVHFTHIALTNANITVAAGGCAGISREVLVERFTTKDANGILLAGPIDNDEKDLIYVDTSSFAKEVGGVFGRVAEGLSDSEAASAAARIIHAKDKELAGEVFEKDGQRFLRWGVRVVKDEDAVAYSMLNGGARTNFMSLRMLFSSLTFAMGEAESGSAEIVVCSDTTLNKVADVAIPADWTVDWHGEDVPVPRITVPATTRFTVNGELTLTHIVFDGAATGRKISPFDVVGTMTLGADAEILRITSSTANSSPAINVKKGGRFVQLDGSTIRQCSNGCAVSLASGGTFDFEGGTICDCTSDDGAVYALSGSTVNVSGSAKVADNFTSTGVAKNMNLAAATILHLAGELTETIGITRGKAANAGTKFGVADVTDAAAKASAAWIVADVAATTVGSVNDSGNLVWNVMPPPPPPENVRVGDRTYVTMDAAIAAAPDGATIEILQPLDIVCSNLSVTIAKRVKIVATDLANVIRRVPRTTVNYSIKSAIVIEPPGQVTLENVIVGDDSEPWPCPFIQVKKGASLTLGAGAAIRRVLGAEFYNEGNPSSPMGSQAAGVLANGLLTMLEGSQIVCCTNTYAKSLGGGAIVWEQKGGFFDLCGGEVRDCSAGIGGGVAIANGAAMNLSGNSAIAGSEPCNLYYEPGQNLIQITNAFFGAVGYTLGGALYADPNVFAEVKYDFGEGWESLVAEARHFTNEVTGAAGVAATNGEGVVRYFWRTAFTTNSTYVAKGGASWTTIGALPREVVAVPVPREGLVYTGKSQAGLIADPLAPYALSGTLNATDAGTYTAVATLEYNYAWPDGTDEPKEIEWTIGKATYDLGNLEFKDKTFPCDGRTNLVEVVGRLPFGITVSYYSDAQTPGLLPNNIVASAPKAVIVIATASGSDANHEYAERRMLAKFIVGEPASKGQVIADDPIVRGNLVYNGLCQTGVVANATGGFVLVGDVVTNAGTYTATATLLDGAVWRDGTTEPKEVEWTVAQAKYDMSKVVFKSRSFAYDGTPKSIYVAGNVPAGVTTNYVGNGQVFKGEHVVTAQFTGDAVNYKPIPDMTATLTITGGPEPPPPEPIPVDPPTAVAGLVYNTRIQTGVAAGTGYTVTGNEAIRAGDYTAVVTLQPNYVWRDGETSDSRNVAWSIAKATYDMSGVVFTNVTYACDGAVKSNLVDAASLPKGVSVSAYLNNGQTEVGEYEVTAQFAGDAENYEPIADKTAKLTIIDGPTPPPGPTPAWTVVTNHPSPIAFKSIDRVSDTEWKLVVTDRVEYCNYRLIWTKDLAKGFTSTGDWEHAVGEAAAPIWTTNVLTTGGAWFWRAEGADGTNMVLKTEE